MKTITVGELRQNPTPMLDDVAAGETYRVTRHNREIARIVPAPLSATIIPPKRKGGRTRELPVFPLPEGVGMDEYLDEMKGDW